MTHRAPSLPTDTGSDPQAGVDRGPVGLTVRGVRKSFVAHLRGGPVRTVLDSVDLEVEPGSCVVLTGPAGSGKSSLLRCVYRTYLVDAGTIVLTTGGRAVDVVAASDREVLALRARTMGFASQFLAVTPRVAAVDMVAAQGVSRVEAAAHLAALGLPEELAGLPPTSFSGGERQLVGLAVALARPRPFLLLDEVTASLDPPRRHSVLATLAERKAAGTTLLAVFHDLPTTPGLVDRVVRLDDGRVVPA